MFIQESGTGIHGNFAGILDGVSVDPAADCRKRNGRQPAIPGEIQTAGIAAGQQAAVFRAAPIYRSHGVDDVFGHKSIAPGHPGFARRATTDGSTLGQQFRTSRTMYGPIYTASAFERCIGRIDDGINGQLGDVALPDL